MDTVLIERCFGLNTGFLKEDKNLELPETKALLKIIELFPWIIDIADHGFDKHLSNIYLELIAVTIKIEQRKEYLLSPANKSV